MSRTAHRWFASFTVQLERAAPRGHARQGSVVGVDLGVKTLLTGVADDGEVIEIGGPRALQYGLRKLRRLGRSHSRKQRGSANRARAAAKPARHHARVTSLRADALHKATGQLAPGTRPWWWKT